MKRPRIRREVAQTGIPVKVFSTDAIRTKQEKK